MPTSPPSLLGKEPEILARYERLTAHKIDAVKTRIHGDYHLGQVLNTGRDFMIIDFEGEPSRPLSERKLKRSPLRDVAGMLRSFQYAPFSSLSNNPNWRPEQVELLRPWAERWAAHVSWIFLRAYLDEAAGENFVPDTEADFRILLEAFILDKAVYEIGYEMNNRPGWISVPLRGILQILANLIPPLVVNQARGHRLEQPMNQFSRSYGLEVKVPVRVSYPPALLRPVKVPPCAEV